MKNLATIKNYRINLCPLVYGAGIKGKITDSWYYNTPCVTSSIGAEGMFYNEYNEVNKNQQNEHINNTETSFINYANFMNSNENVNSWGGFYSDNVNKIANLSYELYTNKDIWVEKVKNSKEIIQKR